MKLPPCSALQGHGDVPRAAHRRCKEQGPTCNGVAHPGFDVCARCLNDVIRPRMRAEREAVRKRKAARLSKENRALITEVDLKEPQMAPMSVADAVWDAVIDKRVDAEIDGALARNPLITEQQFLAEQLHQRIMRDSTAIPVRVEVFVPQPEPIEEPPIESDPEEVEETHELIEALESVEVQAAFTGPMRPGRGSHKPAITLEQRQEMIDAYIAGEEVDEICRAYDVGTGTLYRYIRQAGVPPRRNYPKYIADFEGAALEEEPMEAKTSTPVSSEPLATPTPNGAVDGLSEWVVTYEVRKTETAIIVARDFNAAAAAVASEPGIEVVSVARKR